MTSETYVQVRGTDLFGVAFVESAQLIAVADSELCLSIWRPVAENALVEVLFYDNENYSMRGQIMTVRNHLNGTQTVKINMY